LLQPRANHDANAVRKKLRLKLQMERDRRAVAAQAASLPAAQQRELEVCR
jgi:hypothetical protein